MSINNNNNQPTTSTSSSTGGSLYGNALSAHDLWNRLAGSPVLRPTTPSITSSLFDKPIDESIDTDFVMADEHDAPTTLESVVHLHELPCDFLYAYFERDNQAAEISTPSGAIVLNGFPVRPRVVCAHKIRWRPVLGKDGLSGHRFDFLDESDEHQAHAEVFVSSHAIHRVALVHRLFTPAARAAGFVDRNSLLEFNSPESHHQRLVSFLSTLPVGQLYLPVNELALGSQANIDIEIEAKHAGNPAAAIAPTVWIHTRQQLAALSEVALRASHEHNNSEFSRAGLA